MEIGHGDAEPLRQRVPVAQLHVAAEAEPLFCRVRTDQPEIKQATSYMRGRTSATTPNDTSEASAPPDICCFFPPMNGLFLVAVVNA
jgi:hypothetical protein